MKCLIRKLIGLLKINNMLNVNSVLNVNRKVNVNEQRRISGIVRIREGEIGCHFSKIY